MPWRRSRFLVSTRPTKRTSASFLRYASHIPIPCTYTVARSTAWQRSYTRRPVALKQQGSPGSSCIPSTTARLRTAKVSRPFLIFLESHLTRLLAANSWRMRRNQSRRPRSAPQPASTGPWCIELVCLPPSVCWKWCYFSETSVTECGSSDICELTVSAVNSR